MTTSCKLLVLDFDASSREQLRKALSNRGHAVVASSTVECAFRRLTRGSFDLMVVRLHTPHDATLAMLRHTARLWPRQPLAIVATLPLPAGAAAVLAQHGITNLLASTDDPAGLARAIEALAATRADANEVLPDLMSTRLNTLPWIDDARFATDPLPDILLDFVRDLASTMPDVALSVLISDEHDLAFITVMQPVVAPSLVDAMQADAMASLHILGCPIPAENRITHYGDLPEVAPAAPVNPKTLLTVPVLAEKTLRAVLTLAHPDDQANAPNYAARIDQAARHLAVAILDTRRLQRLATTDSLTGLCNRPALEQALRKAWNAASRPESAMAVTLIDLDHFKEINDTHGVNAGDAVLRAFAALLRQTLHVGDIAGRFGGDEFAVIMPSASLSDAQAFCETLMQKTREQLFCPDTLRLTLTLSIGVAASDTTVAPKTAEDLLPRADRALYKAKRTGRDRLCIWRHSEATESTRGPEMPVSAPLEPSKARIAMVDDEPIVLQSLGAVLRQEGYDVEPFTDAATALAAIKAAPFHFDIILTDIAMPGMSGVEMLMHIAKADHRIVKIVMTGYASVDIVIRCLREGAIDLLLKPMNRDALLAAMRRAMAHRTLIMESAQRRRHLEGMVEQRSAELSETLAEVRKSYAFTLEALMAMLDARESQTGQHSLRVRQMAIWMARWMHVGREELDVIATGALLHDIGKIAIPDRVLLNPDALSHDDWGIMQQHAELGARIVGSNPRLAAAARILLEHHERYDGQGYPKGLRGNEISLGARIFAVVDTYDAMRSNRVYRQQRSEPDTVAEIVKHSGKQFDPTIVEVFLDHRDDFARLYDQLCVNPIKPHAFQDSSI